MEQIASLSHLRTVIAAWRKAGETIAFVATMGNLHQGHFTLVKEAKRKASKVVVSIFVNPMQFGEGEDFESYPRTLQQDGDALNELGVDLLFTPEVSDVYHRDMSTTTRVEVPGLSNILCGKHRPGHFVGVTTVVAKLFSMVQPDIAVFGKKDYQQLFLIKRMVEDLAMPIDVVGIDTIREPSGLAMSSRNGYLSSAEKEAATELYQSLTNIAEQVRQGSKAYISLCQNEVKTLQSKGFLVDYMEVRRQDDLARPSGEDAKLVVLVAAHLGNARLIDNLEIH